ncbi:hypothetical protein QBC47DRAFT_387331 [Echria macrotheca]|uniref:Zn(2)-C6 fungal-type domain-containing protein n=1 Tax=Echria macrotheca TaxID=438768 RepID=A0AAJ0B7D7_9PEZI|nr:hypothetical protein QBC47DRAFT_387331 [Echria macrotheca]
MSSYPPPPSPSAGAAAPPLHEPKHHASPPPSPRLHPYFDGAIDEADVQSVAVAAAQAVAHHGLQALQAAVSGPPVTPQYAAADPSFLAGPSPPSLSQSNSKATRLRRACDLCSQRKVKCDETQPCRPCRDLQVDCTFEREMKRRGPPNKHAAAAKAAKRLRLEPNISPGPHNAAETLVSIAGAPQPPQAVLDGESIVPWPVLSLLVDDFFTYIHPLAPFPHEPTFRQMLVARQDRTNPLFLALLASMVGTLVASFPRTARLHLKAQHGMSLFPKAITLIERCREVALQSRGPTFYSKDEVTVYDAATSYFLGLTAGYTMQWKICRRFMNEAMSFIREMGYHKPRDLGSSMYGVTYRGPPFDHVQDQLGRRIFWCIFLGVRSMVQLGAPHTEILLPPPTPTEPYPEFPVEVDDRYILPSQILGQPEGTVSLLTGFVQCIRIYMTMNTIASLELSYGFTTVPFQDQKTMLSTCLQTVRQVVENMPPELTLPGLQGMGDFSMAEGDLFGHQFQYYPPTYPAHQSDSDRHVMEAHPEQRRLLQYEIQKANVYASALATRSYFVERYFNLRDAHRTQAAQAYAQENGSTKNPAEQPDAIDHAMNAERELIVQNLVTVLTSISQRNLEPNGASLINKIRQVASTLVNDAPERKGPKAVKAEELLSRFVDILMRLEKGSGGAVTAAGAGTGDLQDEEQELRSWADLREHQMRFFQSGGFIHQL